MKTTDISSNLTHLLGPEGGTWGFLYSSCMPPAQQDNVPVLKKSVLSQQQLGQVRQQPDSGHKAAFNHADRCSVWTNINPCYFDSQLFSTISRDASSFPGES